MQVNIGNVAGISSVLLVCCGVALTATAQYLLKLAALQNSGDLRWYLFIAFSIVSYGFSFIVYMLVLRYFQISKIAPVMTIGTVVLVVLLGITLGESVTIIQFFGIALGIAGLVLMLI